MNRYVEEVLDKMGISKETRASTPAESIHIKCENAVIELLQLTYVGFSSIMSKGQGRPDTCHSMEDEMQIFRLGDTFHGP